MTEKRTLWKTVELFLRNKTNKTSRITLTEEETIISPDQLIGKMFNEYAISIPIKICLKTKNMKIFIHQKKALFQVKIYIKH